MPAFEVELVNPAPTFIVKVFGYLKTTTPLPPAPEVWLDEYVAEPPPPEPVFTDPEVAETVSF